MSITVTLQCSKHPHYKAICQPASPCCKVCEGIYRFKRALKAKIPGAYGYTHDAVGSLNYADADGRKLASYFHKGG